MPRHDESYLKCPGPVLGGRPCSDTTYRVYRAYRVHRV